MTTPAKLFGKNLGEYDEVDVDELLAQLSAEEIKILAKEVDPDVSIFKVRLPELFHVDFRINASDFHGSVYSG